MKTIKFILKEAGYAGLTFKQALLVIWFSLSIFGLTMNEDAPLYAWAFVIANVFVSGLLCAKYVHKNKSIMNFEELKKEVLRRAKEANASESQYNRYLESQNVEELIAFVKENISFHCCPTKIHKDSVAYMKYFTSNMFLDFNRHTIKHFNSKVNLMTNTRFYRGL